MAVARTLLSAIAQFSNRPDHCISQRNERLATHHEEMMFVTVFCPLFDVDPGDRLLRCTTGIAPACAAGHPGHGLRDMPRVNGALVLC